jgi:hypothetical protein
MSRNIATINEDKLHLLDLRKNKFNIQTKN